jgi:hypothetical protein
LEAIRKTAKEKDAEEITSLNERTTAELQAKTSRVHAAFLFDPLGSRTLQTLCRWLISNRNSYNSAGWEEFGIRLGLTPLVIKVRKTYAEIVLCF